MTRLTRAESQARTREQLVATAQERFLESGYFATSLEMVAEAAGYSKGAVYSNFANKPQLCLAVLDRIQEQQVAALAAEFEGAGTLADGLAALERWADENLGNRAWTVLEVEFATVARRDEALRERLAARRRSVRDAIAAVLESLAAAFGTSLALPPLAAADLVLSTGIGLGASRAVDPDLPVAALLDTIRLLVRADPQ